MFVNGIAPFFPPGNIFIAYYAVAGIGPTEVTAKVDRRIISATPLARVSIGNNYRPYGACAAIIPKENRWFLDILFFNCNFLFDRLK